MKVLVTGTNRGIGLEMVRQLLGRGDEVIATCRNPNAATDLQALTNDRLTILPLDMQNIDGFASFTDQGILKNLDGVILNAGIYGAEGNQFDTMTLSDLQNTLLINAVSPLLLIKSLMPALSGHHKDCKKRILAISSVMGSMGENTGGSTYAYRASKAAMNAYFKSLQLDFSDVMDVVIAHPGWVLTDMGGGDALLTPEQSVSGLLDLFDNSDRYSDGNFYDYSGSLRAW